MKDSILCDLVRTVSSLYMYAGMHVYIQDVCVYRMIDVMTKHKERVLQVIWSKKF